MDPVQIRIEAETTQALNAVVKLREEWVRGNAVYARSISEMSLAMNRLSGDAALRAAQQYVQAINQIGGVNRLTEHEQARVNKVLQEAADKYRALGQVVPAEMQKIINATAAAGRKIQDSLATSFSGTKVANEATKIVQAIEKIGGVSKLTETELKKVSKVLEEAANKSAKMGEEVPRNIRKVLDEVRKLTTHPAKEGLFSGQGMMREANSYLDAIRKIGGVNKLTISEQAKVNRVLEETIQKYRALGRQVPRELQAMADATRHATQQSASHWGKFWAQVAGGVIAGQTAVTLASRIISDALQNMRRILVSVGEGFVYLVQRGSEVHRIAGAFKLLSETIQDSQGRFQKWNETLAAGREGSKGLISDFNLMQAANRAILLGLPLTSENFKTLTGAALQLGRAMGLNARKAIDDLVIALGRSSPRILDNLGIIVKIRDATRNWAHEHGKTVQMLTAEERTLAFYEEAMRKIKERLEQLGPVVLTLSEKFEVVKVALQNFRDRLALAVELSPVLNVAMDEIGNALARNLGEKQEDMIRRFVKIINEMAIVTVKSAAAIIQAIGYIAGAMVDWARKTDESKESIIRGLRDTLEIARLAMKAFAVLPGADVLGAQRAEATLKSVVHGLNVMMRAGEATKNAIGNTAQAIRDGANATSEFLNSLIPKMEAVRDKFVSDVEIQKAFFLRTMNEEGQGVEQLTEKEKKALEKRAKNWKALVKQLEDLQRPGNVRPGTFGSIAANADFWEAQERMVFGGMTHKEWLKLLKDLQKLQTTTPGFAPGTLGAMGSISDFFKREEKIIFDGMTQKVFEFGMNFGKALKTAARAFSELATISDTTFGKMMKSVGEFVSLMNISFDAGKNFRAAWNTLNASMGKLQDGSGKFYINWKNAAAAAANMALQLPQMIAAMDQATSSASKMQNVLGGAAQGAAMGTAILPGWGTAIGAGIGALIGLFRKQRWAELMRDVGKEWGVAMSEGLAKTMMAEAKAGKFGGDLVTVTLSHIKDLINEAGGLTAKNIDLFTRKLRDIFSAIEGGKMSVEEGRKIFEDAFPMFIEQIERQGGVASDAFLELIKLQKRFGFESKAVMDWLKKQVDTFASAITAIMGPKVGEIAKIIEKIKEAEDALKKGGLRGSQFEKMTEQLRKGRVELGRYTKDVKDWGIMIAGAFQGALNSGMSYYDAFGSIQGALKDLIPIYDELKKQGVQFNNVLFEQLIAEAKLVEKNPALVASADAYDDLFKSMQNLGGLTQSTFAATERQMLDTVNRMKEAGFTQDMILRRLAPALDEIVRLQAAGKIVVDQQTQALIDQARQQGLLGKQTKTTTEIMTEGFKGVEIGLAAIIEALGGEVPEALKKLIEAADASEEAITNVTNTTNNLKRKLIEAERTGVESFEGISQAAQDAQHDINGVSFGSSPGGIKEIPIQLAKALRAVQDFEHQSRLAFGSVRTAVEGIPSVGIDQLTSQVRGSMRYTPDPNFQPTISGPQTGNEIGSIARLLENQAREPRIMFKVDSGAVQQNLSTWTLGTTRELVRDKIGPELLEQVGGGGRLYDMVYRIVLEVIKNHESSKTK